MTNPRLSDLLSAYTSTNLILYAGAGISAAAGLPTWPRLAADLLARLRTEHASPDALAEIDDLLNHGHLVDALSAVKHALGDNEFNLAIEKACNDKPHPVPDVALAIAALEPHLRAVLTTNLDHFLERAFAGAWPALTHAPGDLASRRGYILKFHGTLIDRMSWVFSRDQYDRAIFASPATRGTLEALFRACPILFVGCGLADDDLDQTFAAIRALSGDQPPTHFALVAAGSVPPYRRKKLEAAGLRLVEYDNADGKHAELPRILRSIAGANASATPPPAATQPGGTSAVTTAQVPAPAKGPLLDAASIHAIYGAAVATGIAFSRGALLAGIDPAFVAGLPNAPTPAAQVLVDLHELNRVARLADGSVVLVTWLSNAVSLAGPRTEAEVFRRSIDEIRARLGATRATP